MPSWDDFDKIPTESGNVASSQPVTTIDNWNDFDRFVEEESLKEERELERQRQVELDADREDAGIFTDIGHGLLSGGVRGVEGVAKAVEWVAPEDTWVEEKSQEFGDYLEAVREENPDWFSESIASEKARESSAWDPRGWLYGGMESLGMLAPGLAVGVINPIAGAAVTGGQFWGSTAQDAYDEAVANEKAGIGKKLTESEKIVYSNLRGFFEGGVEMIQSRLPFMKLGKFIPKAAQQNIIRSAVTQPGNPLFNSVKSYLKTIAAEVPMELGQEYAGQKTAYKYGQSEVDPGWDDIKAVIGPTIVMSAVLSTAGQVGDASKRKSLHNALTKEDVNPKNRLAAVMAVHNHVKGKDTELAKMWLKQTLPLARQNKPVALPLDEDVRTGVAELEQPQTGVRKLDEALEQEKVRNAQLKAEVEAVDERKVADSVEAAEPVQETVGPDGEVIIEPVVEAAPQSIESLTEQINNVEALLERNPKLGTPEIINNLKLKKQQRAALLTGEQTIDQAITRTDIEQNEEGYDITRVTVGDLNVAVENPVGTTRKGVDETGAEWSQDLTHHYGYIEGVEGQDKEKLDVFVKEGSDPAAPGDKVFIVNQKNLKTGEFDEHKVMIGFDSVEDAREGYLANYDKSGPSRVMSVEETTTEGLKEWTKSGKVSGVFGAVAPVKPVAEERAPVKPVAEEPQTRDAVIKDLPVTRGWRRETFTISAQGWEKYVIVRDTRQKDGKSVTKVVREDGTVRDITGGMADRIARAVKNKETVPYDMKTSAVEKVDKVEDKQVDTEHPIVAPEQEHEGISAAREQLGEDIEQIEVR